MSIDPKLKDFAYYKTGGRCEKLYQPRSIEELQDYMAEIGASKVPYFILGGGTNSLVLDDFYPGRVVSLAHLNHWEYRGNNQIYCEAGVTNTFLSEKAWEANLGDLSWMNYLPGQVGGTVRMNARCYGGEISQVVRKVWTVCEKGELREYDNSTSHSPLFFGYKNTVFMNSKEVVASVLISSKTKDPEKIRNHMNYCRDDREGKNQFAYPSCGCVFKNDYQPDVSVPSGLLLEHCGLKGLKRGRVQISDKHANFVFNQGATSREIIETTLFMREKVWEEFGVWLSYEMEILGDLPTDLKSQVEEKRAPNYQVEKLSHLRQIFQKQKS